MSIDRCGVALKEWAVTCRALARGRQVVLVRKGGILDEDGAFALEHTRFWLQPTYDHQDVTLLQPEQRDLLAQVEADREAGENKKFMRLQLMAEVARVYALGPDDRDCLRAVPHIWSSAYLDLRLNYKPERPLLCVALRVSSCPRPHMVPMRDEFFGCRSWIELEQPLDCETAVPVLDDAQFAQRLAALDALLKGPAAAHSYPAGPP